MAVLGLWPIITGQKGIQHARPNRQSCGDHGGGLGDLGYACAQRLIEEGCRVTVLDAKPDTRDRARAIGAYYLQVDITQAEALKSAFDQVAGHLGPCSILVNCAALFLFKGVDASLEEFERICAVNIAGTSLVTRAAVEHMKRGAGGSIINFSSISGFGG
jgi:NAD(P)-dependent dehydrogenase (short-subunit alcohol dehydrogenase family)